ncbi:MAG: hypothetical protein WC551_11190 [Patescibacteria group bacterium]
MKEAQNTKKVLLVPPQLKDNAAFASNTYVDTAGWGYVEFVLISGTMDADIGTDDATTAVSIEQCDTTDGTYAAVTNAALADVFDDAKDNKIKQIDIDLSNGTYKRYMELNTPTAGDGTTGCNFCAIAILSKPIDGPATAAERGLDEHVII